MAPTRTNARTRSRDVETVLLQAADIVLRRDGFEGVTVRSVAAEAGVAPVGLYSRFGSKEGLVDALLLHALDNLEHAIAERGEVDPIERVRSSAQRYRRWALANPQHYQALFLRRDALHSEVVRCRLATMYQAGCANIEYAMARGAIREGDVNETTLRFWCATHGAIAFELHNLFVNADAEPNFDAVVDMVVRGLAPPGAADY
ncbi:MAG: TetR/AcrR family transcriptional regulator [Sporichthyaceae bacterium]